MKKLIKESLGIDSTVSADEFYIVCKSDFSDLKDDGMEVYTSIDEARPHAMFLNSQAAENDELADYYFFSIQDLINEIIECRK